MVKKCEFMFSWLAIKHSVMDRWLPSFSGIPCGFDGYLEKASEIGAYYREYSLLLCCGNSIIGGRLCIHGEPFRTTTARAPGAEIPVTTQGSTAGSERTRTLQVYKAGQKNRI